MNGLREKFRNKKGFTLIEMLIVVAIVAILIAISIPLIGNALEKARDATDQANERAAKAEAVLWYMGIDDKKLTYTGTGDAAAATMLYDADKGTLVETTTTGIKPYGQCTGCNNANYPNSNADHREKCVQVSIKQTSGEVTITWVDLP